MVEKVMPNWWGVILLSVLALSSRFDGRNGRTIYAGRFSLSVLALSSRFDGHTALPRRSRMRVTFSTRSVESF